MEPFIAQIPSKFWSQGSDDVGLMKGASPLVVDPKSSYRPCKRQYSLKAEAIEDFIQDLIKSGVIVPCPDSPCNTLLFPVKKAAPSTGS